MARIATAQTTNAATDAIGWAGGPGVFSAWGTWGGATAKLQWSPDGSTWLDVDRSGDTFCTLTANGGGGFTLPPCTVRANITGGTAASLSADVSGAQ